MNGKQVGILLLQVFLFFQSPPSQSADSSYPFITELDPYSEGFSISCDRNFDLTGYYVTDGEGILSFTNGPIIPAGGRITFVKSHDDSWFASRDNTYAYGEQNTVKKDTLTFSDSGDELEICRESGIVIDSVCYGKSKGATEWSGSPAVIKSNCYLKRTSQIDTDTAQDWIYTKPGWSSREYTGEGFECWVSPFVFPDSNGIPVIDALESAKSSIDISIYLISSKNVAALLQEKASAGIKVRILAEGKPLGVDTSSELSNLGAIKDAGGEIHLINSGEHTRYTYVHNKYAIIDNETTVITSENWTAGNIGTAGNRGWGAIVESKSYAEYMFSIFENDFSLQYGDVCRLEDAYPNLKPQTLKYYDQGTYNTPTFKAAVIPVLSPDNSYEALRSFVTNSSSRIYAEEMDLGSDLSGLSGDTPVQWMQTAAENGLDVKFILDSSQGNGPTHETYVNMINAATKIDAKCVNGTDNFSLIHNKGIIQDDKVWVGSVNWTTTSFYSNRETAAIFESKDVADFFATYFLEDFGISDSIIDGDELQFTVDVVEVGSKSVVKMSVKGINNQNYLWELGNGVVRSTSCPYVVFDSPQTGNYTAKVTLEGTSVTGYMDYSISGHSATQSKLYLIIPILIGLGVTVAFVRGRKNVVKNEDTWRGNTPNAFRRSR